MPISTSNVPEPQVAENLHALQRIDVRMQVPYPHAELLVVLREILGHALGQRRHQHPLPAGRHVTNLGQQVVDLSGDRTDVDHRIDQSRRPDDLLDDRPA